MAKENQVTIPLTDLNRLENVSFFSSSSAFLFHRLFEKHKKKKTWKSVPLYRKRTEKEKKK